MDKTTFFSLASAAADAAAEIQLSYLKEGVTYHSKSVRHDRVTQADTESEAAIVERIRRDFPDHNIYGEEEEYRKTRSDYTWIIDPLDGTNNFSKGFPFFAVSIALSVNGNLIGGLVRDPVRNETFSAYRGTGAYCNGESIHCSETVNLQDALLATGFYYDRDSRMEQTLREISCLFRQGIVGIRRTGSAALDLSYIAAGRFDGFWEFRLHPWDFAAGALILSEAGGMAETRELTPLPLDKPSSILASNGYLHSQLHSVLETCPA
ncbi:MAG: inositol monophosphatase [Spirochaetales bacterium]|nr:inositol monophosphatase [Spirochaetales bacterium]MCF7939079.1 inositol monophosphatase [Spirochaetales bacterium]